MGVVELKLAQDIPLLEVGKSIGDAQFLSPYTNICSLPGSCRTLKAEIPKFKYSGEIRVNI
jgi:hypothetical protein